MRSIEQRNRRSIEQAARVSEWNGLYRVGTEVIVKMDDGSDVRTRTRSEAWLLQGHTAVILLEGRTGGYLLERLRPVSRERTHRRPPAGKCAVCGCTDEYGCDAGCSWANEDRNLCTACVEAYGRAEYYFERFPHHRPLRRAS